MVFETIAFAEFRHPGAASTVVRPSVISAAMSGGTRPAERLHAGPVAGSHDIVLAADGDDTVFASAGRDIVLGEDGSDDLIGNGGNDVIEAGHTDDVAFGGPGNDVVVGDDGNDVLYGNFGGDTVVGADGNDYINGDNPQPPPPGPLNPAINPAPNNDACSGGPGLDTVANRERGGDGSDPGGPSAPPPPAPIL